MEIVVCFMIYSTVLDDESDSPVESENLQQSYEYSLEAIITELLKIHACFLMCSFASWDVVAHQFVHWYFL